MNAPTCAECGAPMALVNSRRYGKSYWGCTRWRDTGCRGTHGAHPDGRPLGIPGTQAVRDARQRAHFAFDQLHQDGLLSSRTAAYRWLRRAMGLSASAAHIGRFTIDQCEELIRLVGEFEDERSTRVRRRGAA